MKRVRARPATVLRTALAAAGLAALAACGGEPSEDPAKAVVARVGGRTVSRAQLETYLAEALGGPEEASAADPEVKSRLLDQLLDEELLLAAAAREGLAVSEEETRGAAPDGGPSAEAVRRSLLQKKLKEEVILGGVNVTDAEVRAYFEAHLNELRRPARVVIRQILMDAAADAEAVRGLLDGDPGRFEELAAERSLAPDGGRAQALEEGLLPDAVRAAVASLAEGQISPVVADPQGWFILKLEQRQSEQAPTLERVREGIELRLLQERGRRRYQEFVASLRQRTRVRVTEAALGFAYVKRDGS